MTKIAIVYWSGTGNTQAMANLVLDGAMSAGGQADLFTAGEFTADKAKNYTAIAFGCPSMGSEQLEESEFEPMYQSVKSELGGKTVALFGSYGWGDGEWMRNWAVDCESAGCRMIAEPVTVNGAPEGLDAEACKALGKALAQA
ncbi:flavodoxin [Caproiciproducens sp. NJN-50]|uniref:flavodoxin n=1 Tax=Acutalibacteraceae TaxID=3082771 RepID=UPI000FFE23C3|nr:MULTISPECIES: flavodoxin [Acutalibacteraceae]QAT50220.1 flavodoxin [Caproiciproducens sp. NJN-50]